MADRRDTLGKPEEENTAVESTQSASGLGGGIAQEGPAQPHERARKGVDEKERDGREEATDERPDD
jgi:hypothetical protein